MPTPITFTIDDLDVEILAQDKRWENRTDFTDMRNLAYRRALSEYESGLVDAADPFVIVNNLSAPQALGTLVNFPVVVDWLVPTGAQRIFGDTIMLMKPGSPATRSMVKRIDKDDLIPTGTGHDTLAFWEVNGGFSFFAYDVTACPASSYLEIYGVRSLDATQTTGATLDIKHRDFDTLVTDTIGFLEKYI